MGSDGAQGGDDLVQSGLDVARRPVRLLTPPGAAPRNAHPSGQCGTARRSSWPSAGNRAQHRGEGVDVAEQVEVVAAVTSPWEDCRTEIRRFVATCRSGARGGG